MKKFTCSILRIALCFLFFFSLSWNRNGVAYAQAPQGINYQAVARNASNVPIASATITVEFKIHQGSDVGTVAYHESYTLTTSPLGLFSAIVGKGAPQGGFTATDFTNIPWATNSYWLEVLIDPDAGGAATIVSMGATQLMSVPYALSALSANPSGAAGGDLTGNYPIPTVSKIQTYSISTTAPTNGQVLKYNGSIWEPSTDNGNSGTVTNVMGTAPIAVSNGTTTPTISISTNSATSAGVVPPGTGNNNKFWGTDGTGTPGWQNVPGDNWGTQSVNTTTTSITGNGTSGNPLDLANVTTGATKGNATNVPQIIYDNKGRITTVNEIPISGDNWGSQIVNTNTTSISGDGDGTPLDLTATGVAAGTYSSLDVDVKGRVTGGTNPSTLAGYGITDAVTNAGATPSMQSGPDASKPAAGTAGRIYIATDTKIIYRDNGGSWDVISGTGTVTSLSSGNLSPLFTTSVATPTTTPTLTYTLSTVGSGNQIFASPDGGAGQPVFRSLVANDIPGLDAAKITSGILPIVNGGTNSTTANGALNNLLPAQAGNAGKFLNTDGTTTSWFAGNSGTVTSVDISGGTTGLTFGGSPVTTAGTLTLTGTLGVANGGTGLSSNPANGQLLIGNGTGYSLASLTAGSGISITNGAGSVTITATGTSGISNLNGETGATQSFAIGTAGTAPAFNSAANVHTLDIPMASSAGVTAGLLTKADYDVFNNKQTSTLANGEIWIGNGGVAAGQNMSGDATISNTGILTIEDNAVDGTDINLTGETTGDLMYYNGPDWLRLPPGTPGQVLQTNGAAAPSWTTTATGTGTASYLTRWATASTFGSSVVFDDGANIGIGQTTFGTSAAKVLAIGNGTAPGSSPADAVQLWSADRNGIAGQAALHLKSENGTTHVFGDIVGINTTTPNTSAVLDISASNKGILIPQVGLTDINDNTTITNPATSLLVYNTNTTITGGNGVGFYYNAGTAVAPAWVRIFSGTGTGSGPWFLGGNIGTNPANDFIGTKDGSDFVFITGGATSAFERMRISATGNVGIGNTPPNAPVSKLHVVQTAAGGGTPAGIFVNTNNANLSPALSVSVTPGGNQPSAAEFSGGPVALGDGSETGNQPVVVWLKNTSGSVIGANEIVVVNPVGLNGIMTVGTAGHTSAIGVTLAGIGVNGLGKVAVAGVAKVTAGPSGAAAGQHVITSTTQGRADGVPVPASPGQSIGVWLETIGGGSVGRILLR